LFAKRIVQRKNEKIVKHKPANRRSMENATFKPDFVAPCGINCILCKRYQALIHNVPKQKGKVSHCKGCRPREKSCLIKRSCKKLSNKEIDFCFECVDMPCKNLSRLEKRYAQRYSTSLVANLLQLKEKGMTSFLAVQEVNSKCLNCGGVVSMHDEKCYSCGKTYAQLKVRD
jgi:hypothetical protein